MKDFSFLLFWGLLIPCFMGAQEQRFPSQPELGPGGAEYLHAEITMHDFAEQADGYWLFTPAAPVPEEAPVVVFVHGYGAYNPMIYGQWIRHLVRKGNIVLFPRYQESIFSPRPEAFAQNVAQAILDAQKELTENGAIRADWSHLAFMAHSYGGVITADLAVNFENYGIPQPKAALLCSPGTGPLTGGRLKTYADMPADLKLLIVVSDDDPVVGDEFGIKVYETATAVKDRNFLRQFADRSGDRKITAGHNEPYCVDEAFDSGMRNFTTNRALRITTTDPVDYLGYWKLGDALLDCSRQGTHCQYAFGNTVEQRSLGQWSDGTAVKELKVSLPQPE